MPLITRDNNLLTKHITDIEITTPNILGLQNQINVINARQTQYQEFFIDTINGDNNNDGLTPDTPVKDMERAFDIMRGTTGGIVMRLIGDTTAPRTITTTDLWPTYTNINISWLNVSPLEFQIQSLPGTQVDLVLDASSSGDYMKFVVTTFFTFANLNSLTFTHAQIVCYNAMTRFGNIPTVNINNPSPSLYIFEIGKFQIDNCNVVLQNNVNLFNITGAGAIAVYNSTLTDAYATANGLTARTWTTATNGIIRDASGSMTNLISNVIK